MSANPTEQSSRDSLTFETWRLTEKYLDDKFEVDLIGVSAQMLGFVFVIKNYSIIRIQGLNTQI